LAATGFPGAGVLVAGVPGAGVPGAGGAATPASAGVSPIAGTATDGSAEDGRDRAEAAAFAAFAFTTDVSGFVSVFTSAMHSVSRFLVSRLLLHCTITIFSVRFKGHHAAPQQTCVNRAAFPFIVDNLGLKNAAATTEALPGCRVARSV